MSTGNLEAQVAAARAYEALFVPALFTQWVPIMVEAAQLKSGQSVLDVACGTGVLARAAYEKVGPDGSVTGLDPGAGMLAVARERCPSVHWREGDGRIDAIRRGQLRRRRLPVRAHVHGPDSGAARNASAC